MYTCLECPRGRMAVCRERKERKGGVFVIKFKAGDLYIYVLLLTYLHTVHCAALSVHCNLF